MVIIKMLHTIDRVLKRLDDFKKQRVMAPTEKQVGWASLAGDLAVKVLFEENEESYNDYLQVDYDSTIEHLSVCLAAGGGLTLYLPRKGRFGVSKYEVNKEQVAELVEEICCDLREALCKIRETVSNIHNDDNLLAIKLCLLLGADWHSVGKLDLRVLTDVLTGRERFIPDYGKNLFTQEEREIYFPKGVIDITDRELLNFLLLNVSFSINAIPFGAKSCYSDEEAYRSRLRLPSIHSYRKTPLSETALGDFFGSDRVVGVAEEDGEAMLLTLLATTHDRGSFLKQVLGARNVNLIEGIDTNLSIVDDELKKTFLNLSSKALQKPSKSTRQGLHRGIWRLHEGALGQEEVF